MPARFMFRLGAEVTRKSNRTRRRFQQRLERNLGDAVRSVDPGARVLGEWNRIYVDAKDERAAYAAARVFGLSSFSRIDATVPCDLEAIVEAGQRLYANKVRGKRYAVRARRVGRHDFTSRDIKNRLGAALNQGATVDLSDPEITISVEARRRATHLFSSRARCAEGLPLGVQGGAVCLISGGFDSAAAAWMMLRRGVRLDYVFCNLAGAAFEHAVIRVAKLLADRWSYGDAPKIHLIDFAPLLAGLRTEVTPRYWQVVLKRFMYRAAERVARNTGSLGIVTGESLGQVSSQTLPNLGAIQAVSGLPILRPLIGLGKAEIIRRAEMVGTAALSARIKEYCAILEGKPVTSARKAALDREESRVASDLVDKAAESRRTLDLRSLRSIDLGAKYLWVNRMPARAQLIDCRLPAQLDRWRMPGAWRVSPRDVPELADKLHKDATYVLFCDNGVQSGMLAEMLQKVGFEAYALRGGTKKAKARDSGIAQS